MTNNATQGTLRVYHKQHAAQVRFGGACLPACLPACLISLSILQSTNQPTRMSTHTLQESAPYLGVSSDKAHAEQSLSDHCTWTIEELPKGMASGTCIYIIYI